MSDRSWLLASLLALGGGLCVNCSTPQPTADDGRSRVVFRASKVHGLLNFVQTIRGDAHRSPVLKELFEQSELDQAATAGHLDEFDRARRNLNLGVTFDGYPVERRVGRNLSQLFLIQSAFARDLEDLRERTIGMLPQSEQTLLFASLTALEPVYDELVWNRQREALEAYRGRIADRSREWGIEELFAAAAAFYGSNWPQDVPFTIALYPLPGAEGTTSAESIGGLESVGVLLEERDLARRFGVIFHEICHSLYEAQAPEFQHELERDFTGSSSPHARLAYLQINEALATALGNGWAYSRAAGREETRSWYDDERVDGFAKGLYPVVVDYLDRGQPIDAAFIERAIAVFASLFPDSIYEYGLLLDRMLLIVDGRTMLAGPVVDELRRRFRVSSVSSSSPLDHPRSLATVEESGETLVVVVGEEQKEQLSALARAHPQVADRLDALLGEPRDYLHATVDGDGRAWIIIKARDLAGVSRAIERMHAQGRIDPASPMTVIGD